MTKSKTEISQYSKNMVMILGVVILFFIFNALTNHIFMSVRNLTLLLKQGSVLMIVASGLMMLLVERNFDLSGGAAVYFISAFLSQMIVNYNLSIPLAITLSICMGLCMGAMNGFFVGIVGVPAFIGTLAAQQLFKGIGYTWTNAATIGPIPESLQFLSEGYIPPLQSAILLTIIAAVGILLVLLNYKKMKQWYNGTAKLIISIFSIIIFYIIALWIFTGYYGIPMCVFFAGSMVAITGFISQKSVFGRNIYSIGGNPEAARLSGIKTKIRVFQSYLYMGLIYGIAGIVITARLGGSTATTGNLIELDAVAAACIGGTSMSGGVGRITGVAMGVFILSAVDNVMSLMNVSSYAQMVVKGLILLTAVCLDVYMNVSRTKMKKEKSKLIAQ